MQEEEIASLAAITEIECSDKSNLSGIVKRCSELVELIFKNKTEILDKPIESLTKLRLFNFKDILSVTFNKVVVTVDESNSAEFLSILAETNTLIIDYKITDTNIHVTLHESIATIKTFLKVAQKVNATYKIYSESPLPNYVFTVYCKSGITPEFLRDLQTFIKDREMIITSTKTLDKTDILIALDLFIHSNSILNLNLDCYNLGKLHETQVSFQSTKSRLKKFVVFDMDSTLIKQECIDEIARIANVGHQVSKITELAMQGEIDFSESLNRRVALLNGVDESVYEEIKKLIEFNLGAEMVCRVLKKMGVRMAVVSGGFMPLALFVKDRLGLDYAFANTLEAVDGKLTGKVLGSIVDGRRKSELLMMLAKDLQLSLEETMAVGDGANDLFMMKVASVGVAYSAKERVQKEADARIMSLEGVLFLMGLTRGEIDEIKETL